MKVLSFIIIFCLFSSVGQAKETQVYFSPNGGCQKAVIAQIQKAHKTIKIAMYDLTSGAIAQELVKAKKRDVIVQIVLDSHQEKQTPSKGSYLTQRGCEVHLHKGSGLMHNKFAIFDGKVLLTGSFNWTVSAEQRNEENLLVLSDETLIREYEKRFEYLWQGARKPEGSSKYPHRKKYYRSGEYFPSSVRFFRN
ncbi:MAG: phospholipase D-like domain-containing protein [Candidatus Omnitrophota bacterium]